ncbi:phosphatidylglycerol lysyltransferase domain-containing protein [Clostridiaceae bacterium HFYG-1003]|nr:phosphatidylglycerol lysyltransferase domain-containing protein [Clostridiaceae bacterium HFYG-1003]
MEFEKLDLKHQAIFDRYRHLGNPLSSVQNFTALYMWKDALGIEICDTGSIVYFRRTVPPIFGFLPPLTSTDQEIVRAVREMKQFSQEHEFPCQIIDAEQWIIDQLARYDIPHEVIEDRDNSEYLYSGEKLRTLSGKKMHSKKNHYNHFVKNQNYEIRPLKGNTGAALAMTKRWLEGRESPYTLGELEGIRLAFEHLEALPVKGITVFVDGVCQAFTISEDLTEDAVLVHVEKASDEVNGLFTFVNSENQKINHPDAVTVNREQDLGIEGLRKAKLSWKPIGMVDKFIVRLCSQTQTPN